MTQREGESRVLVRRCGLEGAFNHGDDDYDDSCIVKRHFKEMETSRSLEAAKQPAKQSLPAKQMEQPLPRGFEELAEPSSRCRRCAINSEQPLLQVGVSRRDARAAPDVGEA